MSTLAAHLISLRGVPTTFDEPLIATTRSAFSHGTADVGAPLLLPVPAGRSVTALVPLRVAIAPAVDEVVVCG
jgi:hypothetical protein